MKPTRYIIGVLIAAAIAWPAFGTIRALYILWPCRIDAFVPDENYVASCDYRPYGSFEHQVFFHGLRDTGRRIREADVIFVGDSRVGFAFSRPNIEAFFSNRGVRFLISSFGYGEGLLFASEVLRRHHAQPTLLVINVAPLIYKLYPVSEPALYAMNNPIASYFDAIFTLAAHSVYAYLCPTCGGLAVMMRSRRTGQWDWRTFDAANGKGAIEISITDPPSDEELQRWASVAEGWVRKLIEAARPRCVVLTDIPYMGPVGIYARELGRRLNVPVLLPEAGPMRGFDKQHLDGHSSVAWTNAFMSESDALVRAQCGGWPK